VGLVVLVGQKKYLTFLTRYIEKELNKMHRKIIRQKTIARNADKSVLLVLILGGLAGIAPWMITALGQYVGAL
jgi:hypothetical protein